MNAPQPLKRPAVDRGARAAVKSGGNLCWPWIYRLREASSRSVASRVAVLGRSGIVAQLVEAMDRADPINRTYEGRAMNDWKLPWDGGCLCGGVRFRVSAPPLLTMACHCTGCQKLSASAYSLTIAVPSDGFAVTRGELVIGGLHGPHRQLYCPHCKNWMFTHPHGLDFFVNVRATMLDKHHWYAPFVEVFTSEKLPWAMTSAVHSFATQPDLEGYAPLVEAFAREGARPA
jgi:hypothetical protein